MIASEGYWCHQCSQIISVNEELNCPLCGGDFVETVETNVVLDNETTQQLEDWLQHFNERISSLSSVHQNLFQNPQSFLGRDTSLDLFQMTSQLFQIMGQGNLSQMFGTNLSEFADDNFEDILALLQERAQPKLPPPTAKQVLKNLKTRKLTDKHIEKNADCGICKDDYALGDEVKVLPCEHFFHIPCIDKWLSMSNTCPLCRHELPTEEPEKKKKKRSHRGHSSRTSSRNNTAPRSSSPTRVDSNRTESTRIESTRTESTRSESTRTESTRTESTRRSSNRTSSSRNPDGSRNSERSREHRHREGHTRTRSSDIVISEPRSQRDSRSGSRSGTHHSRGSRTRDSHDSRRSSSRRESNSGNPVSPANGRRSNAHRDVFNSTPRTSRRENQSFVQNFEQTTRESIPRHQSDTGGIRITPRSRATVSNENAVIPREETRRTEQNQTRREDVFSPRETSTGRRTNRRGNSQPNENLRQNNSSGCTLL